jgi:hypothetical protein
MVGSMGCVDAGRRIGRGALDVGKLQAMACAGRERSAMTLIAADAA